MEKKQFLSVLVTKGRGSLNHNNREFITKNVDADRINNNITYIRQTIEEAYEVCFRGAVDEYNAKQKRKDRMISGAESYREKIQHSGNNEKEFYEVVVQVGNMQDCPVGSELGEEAKAILDEYMRSFTERNPNLYVFNAVMHLDEKTPHLHIDYIPIAREYKQGMKARNSLDKALKEMGIEVEGKVNKHNNRNKCWQEREKKVIEDIMGRHDIKRTADKGLHRQHMTVEQYKAVVEQVHNEVKNMPKQIEETPMLLSKTKVVVGKAELEKLEKRAKLSMDHEKAAKKLIKEGRDELKQIEELKEEAIKDREESRQCLADAQTKRDEIIADTEKKAAAMLRRSEVNCVATELEKERYIKMYNEQIHLNERYEELKSKQAESEKTITHLNSDIRHLRRDVCDLQFQNKKLKDSIEEKIKQATEPLQNKISELKDRMRQIYHVMGEIVKAVGLLAYDKTSYKATYNANLLPHQVGLIDAVEKYASNCARREGFDELAKDMDETVGLSPQIKSYLPKPERKRDRGMSL